MEAESRMGRYLERPCPLDDHDSGRGCGYKNVSILGCGKNPEVSSPMECHHYRCMLNIGLVTEEDLINSRTGGKYEG